MPKVKIIFSIILLICCKSTIMAQSDSDIELRIKAIELIEVFDDLNGSLYNIVKGKAGKGGYDDDYREFLNLFTQNAKHVNDLPPLNSMETLLDVKTSDSQVGNLSLVSPDYIMYWRELYKDPPTFSISPYYIEVDRSNSDVKVRCNVVKEVVDVGKLKFTEEYTYPHKGMKYFMVLEMVLEGDELKINSVSLSDNQPPIYYHIINVEYPGNGRVKDEILCRDNSLFLNDYQVESIKNTWVFTGTTKAFELQFTLPDYSEIKTTDVISSNLEDFSNNQNPNTSIITFKPKPWRFDLDYERSIFSTGDITASFNGEVRANSSSTSLILRKEWGSKKNIRTGMNFHLSSENSLLTFNISDISRYADDVDPDNFDYERIVSLSEFSEEVNFSSLKFGVSLSKAYQLNYSKWWLGVRAGVCQSFSVESSFSNQCDINRSGYYEDLYGVVIDDNGIYDFGEHSLYGEGSLDRSIGSQSAFSDLSFSYRTNVWSLHGFAGYRFVRVGLGEVEDGIWYDSSTLPSVIDQMENVYWSSINIGIGITRRIASNNSSISCN